MSPFLEEVDLHGFPATLICRVAELEALLKEEKKGYCEVNLALETLPLSILVSWTKLKEEKTSHSSELKAFQKAQASKDKQLLALTDGGLKEIAFSNVMEQLQIFNPNVRAFCGSLKLVPRNTM